MNTTFARAVATGTLLALPVSIVTTIGNPAEASAGCVTRAEFRKASQGMKMSRVHHIFDTSGFRTYYDNGGGGLPPAQSRAYDKCSSEGLATTFFEKTGGAWRLQDKSW
jgi:hypothetical protein